MLSLAGKRFKPRSIHVQERERALLPFLYVSIVLTLNDYKFMGFAATEFSLWPNVPYLTFGRDN